MNFENHSTYLIKHLFHNYSNYVTKIRLLTLPLFVQTSWIHRSEGLESRWFWTRARTMKLRVTYHAVNNLGRKQRQVWCIYTPSVGVTDAEVDVLDAVLADVSDRVVVPDEIVANDNEGWGRAVSADGTRPCVD